MVDSRIVRGLAALDADVVERGLITAFPDWSVDSSVATASTQTAISNGTASLDVFYGPQAAVCTCYGMDLDADGLNRIIDVFQAVGMPLYDPQTRERFA